MAIPIQSPPVKRAAAGTTALAGHPNLNAGKSRLTDSGVAPSSILCGPCESAIEGVLDGMVGMSCAGADTAFEVACNAALDPIPFIGEGPSEAVCIAGGIAVGAVCESGSGTLTHAMVSKIAKQACQSLC